MGSSIRLQPVDMTSLGWRITTQEEDHKEAGIVFPTDTLSTPVERLTNGDPEGDGVFDVLMRSISAHLQKEYEAGRITGADFTNVYASSLAAALQTGAQFLVNQVQVEQIIAQMVLIRQQTITELTNTADNIPEGYGLNFVPDEPVDIPPVDVEEEV